MRALLQGVADSWSWAGGLGWIAAVTAADRRGTALGTVIGAAVVGTVLGPAVGGIASVVGTKAAFATGTLLGVSLLIGIVAAPRPIEGAVRSQGLHTVISVIKERDLKGGLWLSFLAGLGLGTINVLAPLQLSHLGADTLSIAAIFFGASGTQAVLAPLSGRLGDRRGKLLPVRSAVVVAIATSVLLPVVRSLVPMVAVVIPGVAAFGTLFVPAAAMISDGGERRQLRQGLVFAISSIAWATGQAAGSIGSGVLAQATTDLGPYFILAGFCFITFFLVRPSSSPVQVIHNSLT